MPVTTGANAQYIQKNGSNTITHIWDGVNWTNALSITGSKVAVGVPFDAPGISSTTNAGVMLRTNLFTDVDDLYFWGTAGHRPYGFKLGSYGIDSDGRFKTWTGGMLVGGASYLSNDVALINLSNSLYAAWMALGTNALTGKLDSNIWWTAWGSLGSNAITGKLDSNVWQNSWGALATSALTAKLTAPANAAGMLTNDGAGVTGYMAIPGGGSANTTVGDISYRAQAGADPRLPIGALGATLLSQPNTNSGAGPFWNDEKNKWFIADSYKTGGSIYGAVISSAPFAFYTNSLVALANDIAQHSGFVRLWRSSTNAAQAGSRLAYHALSMSSPQFATNSVPGTNTAFSCMLCLEDVGLVSSNTPPGTPVLTNTFIGVGLMNNFNATALTSAQRDGVYFFFRNDGSAASSPNWIAVTGTGGTWTTNDTGLPATTNEWVRLSCIINTNSQAVFMTNGVSATTNSSNLPIGVGLIPGINFNLGGRGGTPTAADYTNRMSLYADYYYHNE